MEPRVAFIIILFVGDNIKFMKCSYQTYNANESEKDKKR